MTKPPGLIAIEAEMARQGADALASFGLAHAGAAEVAASLRSTGKVVLLGMGASHAVNRAVEPLYRSLGFDAVAIPVSEQLGSPLPLTGKTVMIASQSGESAEVIRWLNTARGGDVFGFTLDGNSTLGRSAPCLVAAGGPEVAFAATRSLTLTLALHLAVLAQLGHDPAPALDAVSRTATPDVAAAVAEFSGVTAIVASGRRLQGVAEAAALGLCELSRVPSFALEGGQLRHGPMEMMGPHLGVVLFRGDEAEAGLVAGMATSARQAGAHVVVFDCSGQPPVPGVTTVELPRAAGAAAIFAVLPAMQRFMLGFAATRVADVGTPCRSSKITRTE